jgi:hypothetical protein
MHLSWNQCFLTFPIWTRGKYMCSTLGFMEEVTGDCRWPMLGASLNRRCVGHHLYSIWRAFNHFGINNSLTFKPLSQNRVFSFSNQKKMRKLHTWWDITISLQNFPYPSLLHRTLEGNVQVCVCVCVCVCVTQDAPFIFWYFFLGILFTGELWEFLSFAERYPAIIYNILLFGLTSALGQVSSWDGTAWFLCHDSWFP